MFHCRSDLEIRTREGHVALWLALQQLAPRAAVNGSDPVYLSSSVYNDHCMAALLVQKSCNVDATHLTTGKIVRRLFFNFAESLCFECFKRDLQQRLYDIEVLLECLYDQL